MIGIGQVARLAGVSVRTLRHYDALDLLRPAYVDPQTGYRWYEPQQLHRLHRVLAMRDLGFPLGRISELLDDDVTVEQLLGVLLLRRAEASAAVGAEAARLERLEARLRMLEGGTAMSDYDVIIKAVEPIRVVAIDADHRVPVAEIPQTLQPLYPRLDEVLAAAGAKAVGPSLALYDDDGEGELVTAAFPVDADVEVTTGGAEVRELRKLDRVASTVHRGAGIDKAFDAVHAWARDTGAVPTGHSREVYFDCDGAFETWVVEIQIELMPAEDSATSV
jgi:DNA-binding transcriptional MerR regulator